MSNEPIIVVQGGAGGYARILAAEKDLRKEIEEGVKESASAGYRKLREGGSAIDAVVAAVAYMEDSPSFNAGEIKLIIYSE